MNSLSAGKPEATQVAKLFYQDIEEISVQSRKKNQEKAMKAYNDAQDHLTKYLALI